MRAFEAAARTESFVEAAEELGVTPGAVSQHIKIIEGWVDRPLFRRNAKGVELTELGRTLLPDFESAFDALGAAAQALRLRRPTNEIHIAALPCIAQLWLPSRLGQIRRQMPDLKISVTAMETAPNLKRELFDLSLFFEPFEADPDRIEIEKDEISPVCAPMLASRLDTPEKLDAVPLLHDQSWLTDWQFWSEATRTALENPTGGPRYSLYSLAIEEAKAGAGVLMGHLSLIKDVLRDGSLIRPFDACCATGRSLVLHLPDIRRRNQDLQEVVEALVR